MSLAATCSIQKKREGTSKTLLLLILTVSKMFEMSRHHSLTLLPFNKDRKQNSSIAPVISSSFNQLDKEIGLAKNASSDIVMVGMIPKYMREAGIVPSQVARDLVSSLG